MNTLLDAVRTGRCDLVTALITPLTPGERRALLPELTALRREIRSWDWSRRWDAEPTLRALHLAGAACHTGPAAAASWIAARDLRDGRTRDTAHLAALLAPRDPAWRADVAHRLAARTATVEDDYPLIRALLHGTEAPAPTTDGFVHAWARATTTSTGTNDTTTTGRRPRPRPRPLRVALREDPYTAELVPRLFETATPAPSLTWYDDPRTAGRWPAELAHLATEGTVQRRTLLTGTVGRLLRGGRTGHLAFYTDLLDVLDLTTDERAEHTADWIALAADAPSPTAGRAQQTLTALFEAGRLPADRLAEMSAAVLFRPEKKLVRAQLVLLGKALRRDAEDRHALLPATAAAFGHPDTALQEKALKLVAAHLRPDDDALRADLALDAEQLGPALRRTAATLLGALADPAAGPDTDGYEETLPAAPARRPLTTAGRSVAETVELVAALAKTDAPTAEETETALDLLVRHAHQDRTALAAALLPALADRHWAHEDAGRADPAHLTAPELLAAAVLGRLHPADLSPRRPIDGRGFGQHCIHDALQRVTTARAREAALRILTDPLPFLLATPTWDCGTLEPHDLLTRLTAYARQGATPAPADFAQALLRVRRDPQAAAAADALATGEGRRLAAWLTADGEPAPHTRHVSDQDRGSRTWWRAERPTPRRIVLEIPERPVIQKEFPAVFHPLGRPRTGTPRCWHWRRQELAHLAVLPQDRETQAVWLLPDLTGCATEEGRGAGEVLSRLAELGGPAGPALHLAVATGLGARHAEDRLAAVDALLVLAARGELDTALLGRDVAELLRLGTVKPNRLADAARTAAATGAYATTWAFLAGSLPAVLADSAGRGAGELLAVAADCVEHCGPGGPLPEGLAPAAARKGTSQLATQARRLHTALTTATG
ncbi:DUF6493 family protein [Streptomyces erythrochromogenes]|uniref:DUF6493 family protein n=1 Tax=Streptomyces erythrochromogenes TaxID=285574 RepID=UPI003864372D|nr:DUF6493 family protein [Streptomyces erythrochromogenes]WST98266.1 DUF6493 family protein [Streptomyces erythrochromogenes]